MKYSRNSLLLTAGLFSIAAAIAFHAWWPSYKADRNLERYVVGCMPIDDESGSIRLSDIPEKGVDKGVDLLAGIREHKARKARMKCIKEYYFIYSDRMR